ncbi:MAG: NADH-quinone oxidoreductase subunit L [Planctomycetes bacterium]|nr:NADH-quinone oxidoreductase subunit L [Planctomycetota bacterium]
MDLTSVASALPWIPLLPFLGFLINGCCGTRISRRAAGWIACLGPLGAFLIAYLGLLALAQEQSPRAFLECSLGDWISVGDLVVRAGLRLDRLSVVMALVVTGVGSLIHVYSVGYMSHDKGFTRYFAYLNLFLSMMCILVLADNLVLMFVGWEGVGLCSYLLIGFWYEDPAKASAGKKAFIVNRIGDFGFILGIFLIFVTCGTVDFAELFRWLASAREGLPAGVAFAATMLLFLGATGKSAQIPLYVWLPDAMAGPTPVSALIHAATMVTAGVYMVARLSFLFVLAPTTLLVIAAVGGLTALVAGFYALTQNDIKKVLAYSTISQLGYMFLGAGAAAFGASIFHLFTHAFFKALLFLGAGAVIHALHDEQDLRRMGGLGKKLPLTCAAMVVGSLALAGIPPFAGFFSKDLILLSLLEAAHRTGQPVWYLLWAMGLVGALLTAFYSMRLIAMAFLGAPRGDAEAHEAAEDPPVSMGAPLIALIFCSALVGLFSWPKLFGGFERFIHYLDWVTAQVPAAPGELGHGVEWLNLCASVGMGVAGMAAAYFLYVVAPARPRELVRASPALGRLYELSLNKLYVDEYYDRWIVKPLQAAANYAWEIFDVLIVDGFVNGVAAWVLDLAASARKLQTGVVSYYAISLLLGGIALLGYFVLWV